MGRTKLHSSQYIGITEAGEVAFDLSVFDRLCLGNIIITKRLTDALIKKLVENKDHIILHLTCTGMGGSKVEPLVPTVEQTRKKFDKLIEAGFPVDHVVLRVDPIIPTDKGIETALSVIDKFGDTGIKRARYSIIDMYPHVIDRFREAGFPIPFITFHALSSVRQNIAEQMKQKTAEHGMVAEACAEPGIPSRPCLSQTDVDILGLTNTIILQGNAEQRTNCHCPANKKELLTEKAKQCKNACVYCFWRS